MSEGDDEDYNFDEEYGGLVRADEDDPDEYQPEYNVYERVGYLEHDVIGHIASKIDFTHKKGEIIYDPIKRFGVYVDASARKLIQEGFIPYVSYKDIPNMLNVVSELKNARYKNPDAFVLGYAVTKSGGGGTIDKTKVLALEPKIKTLIPPLQLSDVVRYANLWKTLI